MSLFLVDGDPPQSEWINDNGSTRVKKNEKKPWRSRSKMKVPMSDKGAKRKDFWCPRTGSAFREGVVLNTFGF